MRHDVTLILMFAHPPSKDLELTVGSPEEQSQSVATQLV